MARAILAFVTLIALSGPTIGENANDDRRMLLPIGYLGVATSRPGWRTPADSTSLVTGGPRRDAFARPAHVDGTRRIEHLVVEQRTHPPDDPRIDVSQAGYRDHRHWTRDRIGQRIRHDVVSQVTYSRHHPGRRVCTKQFAPQGSRYHHERQLRFIYTEFSSSFVCCPGWTHTSHLSFGCNKPICTAPCVNGGICASPEQCTCARGYTGKHCEIDVDECITEKPCGQICKNVPGGYECHCRAGFHLQEDRQSCRKNDSDGSAFEARDLENDFHEFVTTRITTARTTTSSTDGENEVDDISIDRDYEVILRRLVKLENQIARQKDRDVEASEIDIKLNSAMQSIHEMRRTIENMHQLQKEIYDMRNRMKHYDQEIGASQHLLHRVADLEIRLRSRCRSMLPLNNGIRY